MGIIRFFRRKGLDAKAGICLAVLILSISSGILVLSVTSVQFTETIESHNQGILESYADILEVRMQEVILVSYNLRTEEQITDLMKSRAISPKQRLGILRLLDKLPEDMAPYPMISDYFIYFNASEKVLTSTGFYDAYFYYQSNFRYSQNSYEEWKGHLAALSEDGEYITSHRGIVSPIDEENYSFYARKSQDEDGNWMSTVIFIANDTLKDRCIGAAITGEGYVGIYGEKGEVLAEAAPGAVVYNGSYVAGSGISVLSVKALEHYHMNLVLAMPDTIFTSMLWNAYRLLRNVIVLMIILALLSGSIFIYIYYIRPKNNLMAWIWEKEPKESRTESYDGICASLEQILDAQNVELQQEKRLGRRLLGENYLFNVLRKKEVADNSLTETLRSYYIEMPYEFICVLLYESKAAKSGQEELSRVLGQKITVSFESVVLNQEEQRNIVLLNLERRMNEEMMRGLIEGIREWIQEAQLQSVWISLGSQETLRNMGVSYDTAMETAQYHFLYPHSAVLEYSQIQCHTGKYIYTSGVEEELIREAVDGQLDRVMDILGQIFSRNFEKEHLQIQFARLLLYALLNTVYKVEAIKRSEEKLLYQVPPDRMIMSSQDIYEAKEQIEFIFRSLCEDNEQQQMQDASWRMKRILRYMNDHYLENGLSLDQVAEHFRITPQYLSGLFKKSFNKNFTTYITALRLENACSLMSNPKLTLGEIAVRSGFTNYLALARAFQKYENQTPGEYRKSHFGG